jgi:hypothetical protein
MLGENVNVKIFHFPNYYILSRTAHGIHIKLIKINEWDNMWKYGFFYYATLEASIDINGNYLVLFCCGKKETVTSN